MPLYRVSAHLRVRRAAAALPALRAWPPQVQLHWSDPASRCQKQNAEKPARDTVNYH